MSKNHHPHNRQERRRARRKKEANKLDAKAHKEERADKVWRKLSKESLEQWEKQNELKQVARDQDPA